VTASRHRGKGIASSQIKHFLAKPEYNGFILEMADTNTTAVELYKRLGFVEFQRVKDKHSEVSSMNYNIYMSHQTNEVS